MTTGQIVTAEELLNMPDNGFLYELVKGKLVKMAPAGHGHGVLAIGIGRTLPIQDLFAKFSVQRDPEVAQHG